MEALQASSWAVALCLAAPHLLYAFIWFFPDKWMALFKKGSVSVFENAAWALKVLQFSAVAYWWAVRKPSGVQLAALDPLQVLVGVVLAAAGQSLNLGIYRAIGHAGVYYGFKLGHEVPWVDGFPFNVVRHPQYVGSVLSVWGLAALVWSQAPVGLGLVAAYWTTLYVITGFQEDRF